ncbi:hypothetical protein DPMN_152522 [Dreissena polymorpha]|uniref:Uncharacterized protein n=1 Tax=Dreissena polymorpha TaxID=45954 RepID=A0A9D4J803_DREPO|nr:hypothetical protein DPMN_152522 [Dreissena polymorpha]
MFIAFTVSEDDTLALSAAVIDFYKFSSCFTASSPFPEILLTILFSADDNTDGAGCCGWLLYAFSLLLIVVTLPFSLVLCIKVRFNVI